MRGSLEVVAYGLHDKEVAGATRRNASSIMVRFAQTTSTMEPFTVRNVYYLRISAHTILKTVLYLDQRHVRWLNENPEIWQRAVHELLRPR